MSKKNIPAAIGSVKIFLIVLFSISVCFSFSGASIIKKGNIWVYYSKSQGGDIAFPSVKNSSIKIFIVDTVYSAGDSLFFTITETDSGYDSILMKPIKKKGTNQYVYCNDFCYYWGPLTGNDSAWYISDWHSSDNLLFTGYKFDDYVSLVLYGSDTLHLDTYSPTACTMYCEGRYFQTLENFGPIYSRTWEMGQMTYSYSSDQLISFNHVLFDTTKLHPLATRIERLPMVSKQPSGSFRARAGNNGVATIYLPDHATPVSLSVFDIRGRQIQQFDRIAGNVFQWDRGQLHGLYVVKAMIDGKVQTAKIAPAK